MPPRSPWGLACPLPCETARPTSSLTPPQTECSRLTPCPLPCLYTRFYAIGAYWCYPVVYLNRKSEMTDKLNAQGSRRVLYPSCIVASRYWRVLVLSGCLFKSEIGNRKNCKITKNCKAHLNRPSIERPAAQSTSATRV